MTTEDQDEYIERMNRLADQVPRPVPRKDNPRLCADIDFEPLGNWCLVFQVDGTLKSAGGILIPGDAYGQTFRKGIVCATGEGTVYSSGTFIRCSLKVGDIVMYGQSAKLEINLPEGPFLLIRESECFGKIPGLGPEAEGSESKASEEGGVILRG